LVHSDQACDFCIPAIKRPHIALFTTVATLANARAIMYKTSLGFAAYLVAQNNHC